ncbi:MAG TPA: DUF4288 domain-containing protein [Candidatus Limnocylindria bacterium]
MTRSSRSPAVEADPAAARVVSSGWFAVELRYAYVVDGETAPYLVEDRVVLVDGEDEETAMGQAVEIATQYEDDFEADDGRPGLIRFDGIVAIKELDDPPAAGTEVWHEFMSPAGVRTDAAGEPLPPVWPAEMAFPRAHDG